ncbi:hypothetical protein BJX76DRAFT_316415 [Aspergillus varians]
MRPFIASIAVIFGVDFTGPLRYLTTSTWPCSTAWRIGSSSWIEKHSSLTPSSTNSFTAGRDPFRAACRMP